MYPRQQQQFTEEQKLFEIEKRAEELVPEPLKSEYREQRRYIQEPAEGRIPTNQDLELYWEQEAKKAVTRFLNANPSLTNDEPSVTPQVGTEELTRNLESNLNMTDMIEHLRTIIENQ
jgi:hypothetical protein